MFLDIASNSGRTCTQGQTASSQLGFDSMKQLEVLPLFPPPPPPWRGSYCLSLRVLLYSRKVHYNPMCKRHTWVDRDKVGQKSVFSKVTTGSDPGISERGVVHLNPFPRYGRGLPGGSRGYASRRTFFPILLSKTLFPAFRRLEKRL